MRDLNGDFDGWTGKHIGSVFLRKNHDHIRHCIAAIIQRHENEVEVTFEQPKSKVVHMKLKTKV